jgi:hypothetical protein
MSLTEIVTLSVCLSFFLSVRRTFVRQTMLIIPFVGGQGGQCNMGMRAWQYTGSFPCQEPYTGTDLYSLSFQTFTLVLEKYKTIASKILVGMYSSVCIYIGLTFLGLEMLYRPFFGFTVGLFDASLFAGLMYGPTTTSSKRQ